MDKGAWWATVHRVSKSQTRLRDSHPCIHIVDLQCCIHAYAYSFFIIFSIMVYYRILNIVPCAVP